MKVSFDRPSCLSIIVLFFNMRKNLSFFFFFVKVSSAMGVRRRTRPIDDFYISPYFLVFFSLGVTSFVAR